MVYLNNNLTTKLIGELVFLRSALCYANQIRLYELPIYIFNYKES